MTNSPENTILYFHCFFIFNIIKGELTIFNIKTQFCTASAFEYFSDCTFENQVLVDGQAVLNPVNTCEECKCASGKIDCHQIPCPRPYCNSPRHGTCCQNNCDGETKSFFFLITIISHLNQQAGVLTFPCPLPLRLQLRWERLCKRTGVSSPY